ncbi:hypothetical protein H206_06264 [Candidatus Electrothrix aarhusensis]|uniref:Uncharacterized protein n=1 Tax=Candidatus Electrothrix aarhusensis TaxID=1859131 RepID=A0A444J3U4_9BACT|nr:hypothetical protein H206_06264 [Candidatus Electrothrix aarhusensis]
MTFISFYHIRRGHACQFTQMKFEVLRRVGTRAWCLCLAGDKCLPES